MRRALFFGFLAGLLFFPGGPAAQPTPGVALLRHQWGKSAGLPDWKIITFISWIL